ncbi:MAG TPA: DegT/DnrJ/EryC1/StrS family aminotransferase [bacterium]|nr:DegT/DnrJ/EryC1/StrS family aminotransferase [bacterium]
MIPISRPLIGEEEIKAVTDVLRSGIIASGPKVREFEEKFAGFTGAKHAIAVSNGTCAIHAALFGLGIKKGDRVITTPFTFIATANSVLHAGAEPVFADVDEKTFNIDPGKIEHALKKDMFRKIKAILVVHLYGQCCDMSSINRLAEQYGVKVIEDAAQAHGALHYGKMAGSLGDAASFSMYATKNMATGEGGMVAVKDDAAAEKIRKFINHGSERVYYHTLLGYNYRMTDIEAAIGIVQLGKLEGFNARRRENAARMKKILEKYEYITVPYEAPECFHVFHQFTVKVEASKRDRLLKHLNDSGIGAKIFYPVPIHGQPFYEKLVNPGVALKNSEKLAAQVISLPVYPALTDGDFEIIEGAFAGFDGR